MLKKLFITFLSLAFMIACTPAGSNGTDEAPIDTENPLLNTNWDLVALGAEDMRDKGFTLAFTADSLGGSDSCNQFGAPYTIAGNTLSLENGEFFRTTAGCPEPTLSLADAYLAALVEGGTFVLSEDDLTITTETITLAFEKPVSAELLGTEWQLSGLDKDGLSIVHMAIDKNISLQIEGDIMSGSGGCNSYSGSVTVDGSQISFGNATSTLMACVGEIGERETEFMAMLEQVASYDILRQSLRFYDADGTMIAIFVTPESVEEEEFALLTFEALDNLTYQGIYEEPVTLENGRFEGEPFDEGGASRPTVTRLAETAFGDFNGDAVEDAVVLLAEHSGGSGTFIFAAAVLHRGVTLENSGTILLGDRVAIESMRIENGELIIEAKTHRDSDGLCCPTQETVLVYGLDDSDGLVLLRSDMVGSVLNGRWQLRHTIVGGDAMVPPPIGSDIFLEFTDDRVTGNVGCNNLNGTVTVAGDQMTFAALATTKMLCGDERDNYEQGMLELLNNVTQYAITGNRLVLLNEGLPLAKFAQATLTNPELLNTVWQWVAFEDTAGLNSIDVAMSESYTIQFLSDGTYGLMNDCNSGNGRYLANGSELTLESGLTTLVACGEGSLDGEFSRLLDEVVTYVIEDERLFMNLRLDSGNMVFVAAGE
ncbi:MAG: META domain-containing protein [Chloroflexota bacterium]